MRRAINDREDCEYLFEYTMSFGGFIKKRGLRIKMRNYDPYKKTILFFASLVNIVLMSLVFMYVWFHYYLQKRTLCYDWFIRTYSFLFFNDVWKHENRAVQAA